MRIGTDGTARLRGGLIVVTASLLLALLGACASGGSGDTTEPADQTAEASEPAPAKGVAPPPGHPMAKVELRMRPDQVRKILGEPDGQHMYPGAIWKNFIPFYFGADSGGRMEYAYAGQGRVVFAINRWSRQENVVRIDYDPNETGD